MSYRRPAPRAFETRQANDDRLQAVRGVLAGLRAALTLILSKRKVLAAFLRARKREEAGERSAECCSPALCVADPPSHKSIGHGPSMTSLSCSRTINLDKCIAQGKRARNDPQQAIYRNHHRKGSVSESGGQRTA